MSADAAHEAAAFWGIAENKTIPTEDRLAAALQALEHFGADAMAEDQEPAEPGPEDTVAWARHAAGALNTALAGYAPEDWRDAVRLLHSLRAVTGMLGAMDATLVRWLYLHGEHGQHLLLDGVGAFSITRGRSKERWQVEPAVKDYVEAKVRENDGEMPDPDQVVAWCLEVLPAGTSVSVKKTPLRAAGLDVSDYYESEPGTLQVGLPRPDLT